MIAGILIFYFKNPIYRSFYLPKNSEAIKNVTLKNSDYTIVADNLIIPWEIVFTPDNEDSCCPFCNTICFGVFEKTEGHWYGGQQPICLETNKMVVGKQHG